ncbi:MAG TPA: NlpC/P60 family protein [Jatrophihabitans sp.]
MIVFPRTVVVALLGTLLSALAVCSAQAASASSYRGRITSAFQWRDGSVRVIGSSSAPKVCVAVAGDCLRTVRPDAGHTFNVGLAPQRPAVRIALRSGSTILDVVHADSPGARAVRVAKRYVGGRYAEGGASPRGGFDCSGYTMYVYRQGRVSSLPHNAEAQRHVRYMHHESRAAARPGDLVFYLSGRSAYHVAVYAGHGYQYAAATPADGVRYQRIWSRDVEFRTDWHD